MRKANQDSLAVLEPDQLDGRADGLYIVADGMGGRAGGEVASQLAVEAVRDVVCSRLTEAASPLDAQEMAAILREALTAANDSVWQRAKADPALRGMGTTCIAVLAAGGAAAVGNVGDSRVYRLRDGSLTQVTSDHSLVQEYVNTGDLSAAEARNSRFRNVITRAIGADSMVEPDVDLIELREGDTILLCSDGLTTMVSDRQIARVLAGTADAQEACQRLVDAANVRGGVDNITAVVVRRGAFSPTALPAEGDEDDGYTEIGLYDGGRGGRGLGLATALILLLVVLVGGTVYFFVRGMFSPAPQHPVPRTPQKPAIDLAGAGYDSPVVVTSKPVRGAPLVCDRNGNVYVVTLSGRIGRIPKEGKPNWEFSAPDPGLAVAAPQDAHYLAADGQGYLYDLDRRARSISKYSSAGTRVGVIGERKLKSPQGIAVDAAGDIYVVDGQTLKVFHPNRPSADSAAGQ